MDKNEKKINFEWKKYIRLGSVIAGLFACLLFLFSNVFVVKENEYKVVRQFGEVVKIIEKPGLHLKIPFIQTVESLPKHQLTYDVEEAEINTKDKKRILIDNYAVWRIEDPKEMIANARTVVNAEAKMSEFIFSTVRSELGKLNYDEIINDEKSSRGSLNDKITNIVNNLLEQNHFGIKVVDVRIKRTDLPEANEKSVFTRMISERESKAQEYLSMGDAEKNRIVAETDRQVKEMLAKAEAQAETIRGRGEAEAAKLYNQAYSKDPKFYELYRTLQSYKKTIDGETVIVLPFDSPYAKILMGETE
ncbi:MULTISPECIES: protease modulator HflC [Aeribacillus]|uniref:protease modulator HflC n=1 Tax=Aeribacillus TaxID=1055323 RepID=UPI001023EDEE|nr:MULTISPECIES: protease modulator HflC [Aeribacillus]MDR9796804.1 protease modulator HflC [Aeribacillus pallidus]MED0703368.1 protease modulator HflC [Aeribacillus composti]RZI53273.1 protease modulator HflC [Aeribacillus pallidus]TVZ81703.1 membrane protease subunit HflC [Aeribacillus composti]